MKSQLFGGKRKVVEFNAAVLKIIKCVKPNKVALCTWRINRTFCLFHSSPIETSTGGFINISSKSIPLHRPFLPMDAFVEVCRIKWFKKPKCSCTLVFINTGGKMSNDRYIVIVISELYKQIEYKQRIINFLKFLVV